MPQLTTYQGVADESEVIPPRLIGTFIQSFEYTPTVGQALVWSKPGRGNVPVTFPRWDELQDVAGAVTGVPAGTKAETDDFVDREVPMSEETITPGLVGFMIRRSDEAAGESPEGVPAGMLAEGIRALNQRWDTDVLSPITSLPNSQGAVADTYNLVRFRADVAAYKLLNIPTGGAVAVLSAGMYSELIADVHQSQATLVGDFSSLGLGAEAGFRGRLDAFDIFESQNLPASGAGRAGVMTSAGQAASCLGAVVNELPNVRITRGDISEGKALTQYVLRMWFGYGITNPNRGQQVLGAA